VDHRVAIAAFVLAGVFAGCGGDGGGRDQPMATPRTGRFAMTIVASAPNQAVSLRATGAFDDVRQLFSLRTESSGLVPGLDGPVSVVSTPDALFVDCPYLTRLLAAPTRWVSVRGGDGDSLRASIIDPLLLLGSVGSDDGLVRRTTMRFADGSEEGSALVTLEYFDIGAPVVIEPPAADDVTDETDAVNRLLGGTTGG
jgi:hypothetical protein